MRLSCGFLFAFCLAFPVGLDCGSGMGLGRHPPGFVLFQGTRGREKPPGFPVNGFPLIFQRESTPRTALWVDP